MIVCVCTCCRRWRLERVLRDRLDRRGVREIWRLRHQRFDGQWVDWAESESLDDIADVLVEKKIKMPV